MWDLRSQRRRLPHSVLATLAVALSEFQGAVHQPILVRPGRAEAVKWDFALWGFAPQAIPPIVEMQPKPLPKRALDLQLFEEEELDPYDVFGRVSVNERA